MASIKVIEAANARHLWSTVSGPIDAVGFANLTTFGPDIVTVGGKMQKPSWAQGIDAVLIGSASDAVAAAGSITGVRLRDGVEPSAQYLAGSCISTQTTVAHHYSTAVQALNPMLKATGAIGVDGTPGATDLGSADMTFSARWSSSLPPAKLYWLAAQVSSTAATDLLTDSPIAFGGDTTFPLNVPDTAAGIRATGFGEASDCAAPGMEVGQYRLTGTGLIDNPQDLGGLGIGGEAAATSATSQPFYYQDDWLGVNKGSQIALRAGFTGTDTGTQTRGIAIAFQMA
jgi:hypothetical protein